MYQNHSDISFVEIEASIFHRLAVCWKAERLKALCSALLSHCAVEMKNTLLHLSLCPRHSSGLPSCSYPRISLMNSMLALSLHSPCPSFPVSLRISCIHLKSGSFPSGKDLVELKQQALIYLSWCVRTVYIYLWLF